MNSITVNDAQLHAQGVRFGRDTTIHHTANLYGCAIGDFTKIGAFVEIQKGAFIGCNNKVSSHTFICEGVVTEDNVFIGHNVTFINDRFPRATNSSGQLQSESDWECIPTLVRNGASIGSSATILCGIEIGARAVIGAGSVVTKNVPAGAVVAGNPASILRYLERESA
jgi:acetyltransferase-like isoleucine patch superfamily enzyme